MPTVRTYMCSKCINYIGKTCILDDTEVDPDQYCSDFKESMRRTIKRKVIPEDVI
jgi:hypothetical protein